MGERKPPRRRFHVDISIDGDTWDDVARQVEELLPHIAEHGPACSSVSGGYAGGHWVHVTERPEVSREAYHAALDAYLEARKGGQG